MVGHSQAHFSPDIFKSALQPTAVQDSVVQPCSAFASDGFLHPAAVLFGTLAVTCKTWDLACSPLTKVRS